jgi:hypothetical protein
MSWHERLRNALLLLGLMLTPCASQSQALSCDAAGEDALTLPTMPVDGEPAPRVPTNARNPEGFAPLGWAIEKSVLGDLDQDGLQDAALVLRKTNANNIVSVVEDGCRHKFDTNPRILALALYRPATRAYHLLVANTGLIRREGLPEQDEAFVHTWDPLVGLAIERGIFILSLANGNQRDWNSSRQTLKFRYQNGCVRLIGEDIRQIDTKDDVSNSSISYLTGKRHDWGSRQSKSFDMWMAVPMQSPSCLSASKLK